MGKDVLFGAGPNLKVSFMPNNEDFRVILSHDSRFCASFECLMEKELREKCFYWLEQYGKKIQMPVDFLPRKKLPKFTEKVLENLSQVSFGEVVSYSELAKMGGSPRAVRAVGSICKGNRYPLFYPCHRVIHKSGNREGFAFGLSLKNILLEFENSNL